MLLAATVMVPAWGPAASLLGDVDPPHQDRQIGFRAGQVSQGGFDIKGPLERLELSVFDGLMLGH